MVSKNKLECNKRHKRKQEKLVSKNGRFVLNHLIPLQVLKPGMSVEGVRNVINKLCKFLEAEMKRLDADGQLLQRRFTFVDDERAQKKVENDICDLYPELSGVEPLLLKYSNVRQIEGYTDRKLLSSDLTKFRNVVRNSYATKYFSNLFYSMVSTNKLERNKRHKRKQEKLVKYAESIGYYYSEPEPGQSSKPPGES